MQWTVRSLGRTDVPRVVRFNEPALAWLKVVLTGMTIAFCIGKVIIVDRGHLASDVPVGMTRALVRDPERPIRISDSLYCAEGHNCEVWDQYDMNSGGGDLNWVAIPTAVISETQQRNCVGGGKCTGPWRTTSRKHSRIAGVEDFTLQVEHMFQSPKFYQEWADAYPEKLHVSNPWWGSQDSLTGYLVDQVNTVMQRFSTNQPDTVTVGSVLRAAGIDLDELTTVEGSQEALRDTGVVVLVTLAYHNRPLAHSVEDTEWVTMSSLSPSVKEIYYTYRIAKLPGSSHSPAQTIASNATHRTVEQRPGIQICFAHTGDILYLSTSLLVLTASAAITLLQFSDQVVQAVAHYYLTSRWGIETAVWIPAQSRSVQ